MLRASLLHKRAAAVVAPQKAPAVVAAQRASADRVAISIPFHSRIHWLISDCVSPFAKAGAGLFSPDKTFTNCLIQSSEKLEMLKIPDAWMMSPTRILKQQYNIKVARLVSPPGAVLGPNCPLDQVRCQWPMALWGLEEEFSMSVSRFTQCNTPSTSHSGLESHTQRAAHAPCLGVILSERHVGGLAVQVPSVSGGCRYAFLFITCSEERPSPFAIFTARNRKLLDKILSQGERNEGSFVALEARGKARRRARKARSPSEKTAAEILKMTALKASNFRTPVNLTRLNLNPGFNPKSL